MTIEEQTRDAAPKYERWSIKNASGEEMSSGGRTLTRTMFGREWVSSLLFGGLGTEPEYRRMGLVKEKLESSLRWAREQGASVSLLHPFSFDYYRRFGFERVADHLILDFPINKLDFVNRLSDLERIRTKKMQEEALAVYVAFAMGRNVMPKRFDGAFWPLDATENMYYLHRASDGTADGVISLSIKKTLDVNHHRDGVLTVQELAYTSVDALKALLGFLRMFEGEAESVHVNNIAMAPEIDAVLRHYTHTSYRVLPDISARVLDPEALLKAQTYPLASGAFTLRVKDPWQIASGVWRVRYADGKAETERLEDDAPDDISANILPLAPLLYGTWALTEQSLAYIGGVSVNGRAEDFLRAFTKRPCGAFEHF